MRENILLNAGGFSWSVRPAYQGALAFFSDIDRFPGETLRETKGRRVYRILQPGPPLLVKRYSHAGAWQLLKILFAGSPAAREWRALRKARREGLQVPAAVALGERGRFVKRESVLVMAFVEGSVPLGDYLFGPGRPWGKARKDLIGKFAALVHRAHRRGFYQPDLHLHNILVTPKAAAGEFFFIDLQRALFLPALPRPMRRRNLAVLHGGCMEASRADRLCFLKAYLGPAFRTKKELERAARKLESKGVKHRNRLWRSRARRCVRENREFVRVEAGAFRGFARRDRREGLVSLLRAPETLLKLPESRMVKNSRTTTIACAHLAGELVYVKRYNYQGTGYALKNLFRASRGRRAWIILNSLRLRGIPAPLPLAYVERRRRRMLVESYLVACAVPGENLAEIAVQFRKGMIPLKAKRALIEELARLVRRMHDRQIADRDLKPQNIIVDRSETGDWRFSIVDADGIRLGPVRERAKAKDISSLARFFRRHPAFVQSDGVRFLRAYLGGGEWSRWKTLWHRIAARLDQGNRV